ncbi:MULTISPECIES: DsbA family protein [Roseinatronobacter]|uniref:DsbA family protein n=1 Tax=Roseinatronobacter domitianus TaxID=2940293 RepID=A0ABT0LXY3_9RHOB|nr:MULTISPECIES: DsbA family protein [Roseibaca]MCL1627457.1 DsbA family protein [Roseibaca domitiana]
MTLPLSDSALIGTCLAATALGLIVMTSGGGGAAPTPDTAAQTETAASETAAAPEPSLPFGAVPAAPDAVDPEFGAQVRAYLLQNPEVIFEAVAEFERRTAQSQGDMDAALVQANADALFNDPRSWVGGNPDGDVTLVEFLDYKCGFCKRALPEVKALMEQDPNIRVIIKELPILGPESELAARFAISVLELAGPDAYDSVHVELMEYEGAITPDYLEDVASDLDLALADIVDLMESDAVSTVIEDNRALAQRLQISGTPTFVMGEQMIRGFVPVDNMLQAAAIARQ